MAAESTTEELKKLNEYDRFGYTELHRACRDGLIKKVEYLIKKGVDLNIKTQYNFGFSPLHLCIHYHNYDTAILLVSNGADINAISGVDKYSVLQYAIINNIYIPFIKLLLDNNANLNYQNVNLDTAIIFAIKSGNKQLIQLLLDHNPNLNLKNQYGQTALNFSVGFNLNNGYEITKLLIKHGADPNISDIAGTTPLMWAAEQFDEKILLLLLNLTNDINHQNRFGSTVLHYAVRSNHYFTKKVLSYYPDLFISDKIGDRAIDIAQKTGASKTSKLLLKRMWGIPKTNSADSQPKRNCRR